MEKKKINRRIAILVSLAIMICTLPQMEVWGKKSAKGIVTATELYMRSGPGTDYKNICVGEEKVVLLKDQEITILGERDGWYHIKAIFLDITVEGYSLGQYISVTSGTVKSETGKFKEITPSPTPTPSPSPTPIPTAKGKVTAEELYVRKGPGTDYENVMLSDEKVILVKDQELTILGEKNGWYHITLKINKKKVEGYSLGTYISVTSGEVVSENSETVPTPAPSATPKPTKVPEKEDTPTPTAEKVTSTPTATPTEEPTDTPFPNENVVPLPEGAFELEDGTVYDSEGNELEIVSEEFASKYNLKGIVTTKLLNLRSGADISSSVLGTLPEDTIVSLVGSTLNYQVINDSERAVRWYRVIALIDNVPTRGYVMSDYLRLNYCNGFTVTTKYSKQVIKATPSSKAKCVKTSGGTKVKLAKKTKVKILQEKQTSTGKWFKIQGKYKDENVTGWVPEERIKFEDNAETIQLSYYKQKEALATVTVTEAPSPTITPVPTVTDPDVTDTPTPLPTTVPVENDDIENPNAVVKDAAALSVKLEPKYSAAVLFTDDRVPVMVYSGQLVRVVETVSDTENLWCLIELIFNGQYYQGYVNSIYIEADADVDMGNQDPDSGTSYLEFEESLVAEGFPDSYKPFLRELHEQYPNWRFKAFHTGLDWNEAVKAESVVGENLIPNTKSVEWKSLEAGAYSWKEDKFTVFDGSSWVTASKEAICYYMDPRNFLDHNTIFQFELLNYNPSYQTKEGIDTILKKTAMYDSSYTYTDELGNNRSISYTDTFAMAAEYSGVSPLHLASRVKQEVTIGDKAMSNSVSGTVAGLENLYNFYNIGAYNSTETGGAIANGLRFARDGSSSDSLNLKCLIPWYNRFRSILGGAFYIGNNYINRGQNTIYLQKFNMTSNSTYNHQYMANVEAPYSEGKRVFAAYENPGDIPIVFMIPVYLNMPDEPCPVPAKAYNPNNWLKSIKLYDKNGDKLSLTPTFSITKDQEYSLIVNFDTDYIKIKAATVSSLATVLSDDYIYPEVGENKLVIKVQAENEDIREYVINIVREAGTEPVPTPTPEVTDEPTPTPEVAGEPTPTPVVTGEITPAPSAEPTVTPSPEASGIITPTAEYTGTPTPVPSDDITDTPSPVLTLVPAPTMTDTPTPVQHQGGLPATTAYLTATPILSSDIEAPIAE